MKCKYLLTALLSFILLFHLQPLVAQQQASSFKLFFEKVYLHTDRTWYASGDDIWFKAYLVNAISNYSTNTSNNLYVELLNASGEITSREVIRMDNGVGAGDFKLSDFIQGGSYRLRSYTNWMRNFGNHYVFEKEIQVKNVLGTDKPASSATASSIKTTSQAANKIQFFPEGGSLVEDVRTVVAFKAEDASGNGIDATGSIISSKGDTVTTFKTTHLGMGSFTYKPLTGLTYKAVVKYKEGSYVTADFPAIKPDGFVININNDDSASINVNISANPATIAAHTGALTVAAKHGGKVFYEQKVSLKDGNNFVVIPKSDAPAGIASITLYDEDLHPYCERLVYVDNINPVFLKVSTDQSTYAGKDLVTVNITASDAQQHPVKADLSMAAVDESMDKPSSQNIQSYLMLQSELKGKIENVEDYFNSNNPLRQQQLDLLLLSQGWRSFLWRQIADTNIHISYIPEPGITLSGKVKSLLGNKPLPDMNITLMAPGAKGDKLYTTKTNSQGAYFLDGLGLYGNQTVKINSKSDKGKGAGLLTIDTLFNNPLPTYPAAVNSFDSSARSRYFSAESAKRFANNKNNNWYNLLPGVTVTNQRKTVVLRDGNAYMNFGYPEYDFIISKSDYQYQTLQDFLVHKVPGAVYDVEKEGINFIANGKPVRPRFIVAKKEDVFERIDFYTVHMDQVISVTVRHVVGHPTFNRSENATGRLDLGLTNGDVFLIYLELKPGAYNNDLAFISTDVNGYYESRIFYSPNYLTLPDKTRPDTRTTIHWEPFITTDENGKASIQFYNADPKTTIRINVQGLSDKGTPLVGTNRYVVK